MVSGESTYIEILDTPRSNFLHFHTVLWEIWPNYRLVHPLKSQPPKILTLSPPLENPGSADGDGRAGM